MGYLSRIVFALPLVAFAAAASAEPRTIDDCEQIQAADAYNQCLGSFGPVPHTHIKSQDGGSAVAPPAAAKGRHAHHRARTGVSYAHGSRKTMQFSVVHGNSRVQ